MYGDPLNGWFLAECGLFICSPGVLRRVVEGCVEGALVVDLCEIGDQMILDETKKVYKKEKEMKKGGE